MCVIDGSATASRPGDIGRHMDSLRDRDNTVRRNEESVASRIGAHTNGNAMR
jgi:hypothetical protein